MLKNFRPNLHVEWVPPGSLRCDPCHPHPTRQTPNQANRLEHECLRLSGTDFHRPGWHDHHGRRSLSGCAVLQMPEVPVIRVSHLSTAERRAFTIADRRLSQNSKWNDRLLAQTFKELSEVELDFDLQVTGFSIAEIDLCIEGLSC